MRLQVMKVYLKQLLDIVASSSDNMDKNQFMAKNGTNITPKCIVPCIVFNVTCFILLPIRILIDFWFKNTRKTISMRIVFS